MSEWDRVREIAIEHAGTALCGSTFPTHTDKDDEHKYNSNFPEIILLPFSPLAYSNFMSVATHARIQYNWYSIYELMNKMERPIQTILCLIEDMSTSSVHCAVTTEYVILVVLPLFLVNNFSWEDSSFYVKNYLLSKQQQTNSKQHCNNKPIAFNLLVTIFQFKQYSNIPCRYHWHLCVKISSITLIPLTWET